MASVICTRGIRRSFHPPRFAPWARRRPARGMMIIAGGLSVNLFEAFKSLPLGGIAIVPAPDLEKAPHLVVGLLQTDTGIVVSQPGWSENTSLFPFHAFSRPRPTGPVLTAGFFFFTGRSGYSTSSRKIHRLGASSTDKHLGLHFRPVSPTAPPSTAGLFFCPIQGEFEIYACPVFSPFASPPPSWPSPPAVLASLPPRGFRHPRWPARRRPCASATSPLPRKWRSALPSLCSRRRQRGGARRMRRAEQAHFPLAETEIVPAVGGDKLPGRYSTPRCDSAAGYGGLRSSRAGS